MSDVNVFVVEFSLSQGNLTLRSLQPLFTKLAKSHISAQFFIRVYVFGVVHMFRDRPSFVYRLFPRKGGQNSGNL